ncbi:hypothetical protein SLNWT_5324 [Streptomyces albus]|uniref:Uncharacterized protein n=1 Tax=Streptomyces albus (strain ATCC 21838 / DSM 41398 / FERM P-419 / JCM 4703 / NBRC 107858) TaxID=1081613 RepID=A0A0B5F279_STRA4|nr:hypothetical protein SLNWT_5324 [Streptomyces albus]AOU80002.1 hypothetical protein SLNHY_5311 [Streptomyces albus]
MGTATARALAGSCRTLARCSSPLPPLAVLCRPRRPSAAAAAARAASVSRAPRKKRMAVLSHAGSALRRACGKPAIPLEGTCPRAGDPPPATVRKVRADDAAAARAGSRTGLGGAGLGGPR